MVFGGFSVILSMAGIRYCLSKVIFTSSFDKRCVSKNTAFFQLISEQVCNAYAAITGNISTVITDKISTHILGIISTGAETRWNSQSVLSGIWMLFLLTV